VAASKENSALRWQTFESRSTEFQGFFGQVANRATGDPPQIKTAAPRDIGSGGKDEWKKLEQNPLKSEHILQP
jgi:hypothetical protein